MTEKRFPILNPHNRIKSIPWDMIEPHRDQAKKNHMQSLERLAERGGLTWDELACVLADRPWFGTIKIEK